MATASKVHTWVDQMAKLWSSFASLSTLWDLCCFACQEVLFGTCCEGFGDALLALNYKGLLRPFARILGQDVLFLKDCVGSEVEAKSAFWPPVALRQLVLTQQQAP